MPATNYTPIQLYRSTTSGNVPSAANLSAGEIALNIADNDMTMYFENASGTVKRFFNNPAALKYPTADGTSGQFLTTNGAGVLSFGSVAAGALTNNTRQAVTSSATTTLNLNSGNVIDLTMAANITTLSFTNVPASGTPILIQIVVRNASDGTAYTITWPNSVYWSASANNAVQTAPALATGSNGITVIALLTTDGGTKWRGWVEASIPGGNVSLLYSWGNNGGGQLGLNNLNNYSSPKQVGSNVWIDTATHPTASAGFSAAVRFDNTLWVWGNNGYGQLGQGNTTSYSSPKQVGTLTNWSKVSIGYKGFILARKTDGTLWAWGNNNQGQLGQSNVANYSSPKQVGALTTWSVISAGYDAFCLAIQTDGSLWAWGKNGQGQLGQGNTTYFSSPKQVGALTNWRSVNAFGRAVIALKTDGTLWSWGFGANGRLGQNATGFLSSPTQIGALTTWASIGSTASYNHTGAIKTDGTLWVWGYNNQGKLGLGNTTAYSSPKQVGALTTWYKLSFGPFVSSSIKTDGTLWTWGNNGLGTLGLGTTLNYSSPTQVGNQTTWVLNSMGAASIALNGPAVNPA